MQIGTFSTSRINVYACFLVKCLMPKLYVIFHKGVEALLGFFMLTFWGRSLFFPVYVS